MKLEIKDSTVNEREINTQKGSFKLYSIDAWAHLGGAYPEKVTLNVKEGFNVEPGTYAIHPSSFKVGQYGRLEFNTLQLAKV
jgi:hypothetical protein